MAIGFPAKYQEELDVLGSRSAARKAICGVFDTLGWKYIELYQDHYSVNFGMSGNSWGEVFEIKITTESRILFKSECSMCLQIYDSGKNKKNVRQFIKLFEIREITEVKVENETKMLSGTPYSSSLADLFDDDEQLQPMLVK